MKFSLMPLLQARLLFLQLLQTGRPSSHFKCLSRHVRHPVRTLFGLPDPSPSLSASAVIWSVTGPTLLTLFDFLLLAMGNALRFFPRDSGVSRSEDV